jgi:hypothetical protein
MDNAAIFCSPADLILLRFAFHQIREHFTSELPVLGKEQEFKNVRPAQFRF